MQGRTPLAATILFASCITGCFSEIPETTEKVASTAPTQDVFPMELEPAFFRWFSQPGEMLSVLGNASELGVCAERVHANTAYTIPNLPLIPDKQSPDGVRVSDDYNHLLALLDFAEAHGYWVDVSFGERNNPFFTKYPQEFVEKHIRSYMHDINGKPITVDASDPFTAEARLVPAICDPVITRLASEYIRTGVGRVRKYRCIRNWVIGSEEQYPDYFGLPVGDFRPTFVEQFQQWLGIKRWSVPFDDKEPILVPEINPLQAAWFAFRDQAMADRSAGFYVDFLVADSGERPVLFPTHGNPFAKRMRRGLGLAPGLLAGTADGFEMGHITINSDDESLNLVFTAVLTAYGVPVTAPRLANKTLDPTARGGGRTFTPVMLRRLVYECLGMGLNHIGPIDWVWILPDGEWIIKGTPTEAELARVFQEITHAAFWLNGMARVQPRIALYVSDATWSDNWDPRWTKFFQTAVRNHWHITFVGDAMISERLAGQIPLVVSLNNGLVDADAMEAFAAYLDAGGTIVSWRSFGERDALSRAQQEDLRERVVNHERFIVVPHDREGEAATLVNRFQTTQGAWEMPHHFRSAPFHEIGDIVVQRIGASAMNVFHVSGVSSDGDVTVLPLTDGTSLLAIIINNTAKAETIRLCPTQGLPVGNTWKAIDILQESELPSDRDKKVSVVLGGNATRLLWFAPVVTEEEIREALDRLGAALEQWKSLQVDLSPFNNVLRRMESDKTETEPRQVKRFCIAHRILASLGVRVSVSRDEAGTITLQADVFDAEGKPVKDAKVYARVIPDAYRWRNMTENSGVYSLGIPEASLKPFFNPLTGLYTHTMEARRIVVTAHDNKRSGGAGALLLSPAPNGHDSRKLR